ncbi:helicase [Nocardia sp. CY41]|uniref:helicase n=1 Tax=Nocardia sp. CY41 TaxID=2608686 RepID=UPI001358195D|nr:helicase [Nocardia sp. CY41]
MDTRLREAGIDPATINHKAALRAGRRITAPQPASGEQLEFLTEMLSRRGIEPAGVDESLTSREATRAIKTALGGKQPALRGPAQPDQTRDDRLVDGPTADKAAPAESVAEQVRRQIAETVTRDADLRLSASSPANTYEQYYTSAFTRASDLTALALGDLAEHTEDSAEQIAAWDLLADPAVITQLAHQITEQTWQDERGTPGPASAEAQELGERIAADTAALGLPADRVQAVVKASPLPAQTEIERQNLTQDAIDIATTATTADWWALGRDSFDPSAPLLDAEPGEHPQVVAALGELSRDSQIAQTILADFTAGYDTARGGYCAPTCERLVGEIARDPEVRAVARKRDLGELLDDPTFTGLITGKLAGVAIDSDLTAAAVAELRATAQFGLLVADHLRSRPDPLSEVDAPEATASAVDQPTQAVDTAAEPHASEHEPELPAADALAPLPSVDAAPAPGIEASEPETTASADIAPSELEPGSVAPDAGALPQVPQDTQSVPLSQWGSRALVEAQRPDGSKVLVDAATIASTAPGEPRTDSEAAAEAAVELPDIAEQVDIDEPGPAAPAAALAGEPVDFRLGTDVLVPTSAAARIDANIEAIKLVQRLDDEQRYATPAEQQVLARWSGWGGAWQVFDTAKTEFDAQRNQLRSLLGDREFRAARQSTVNAHYTDPAVVEVMWQAMVAAGLPSGANVLEPGCGAGHFLGHAPDGVHVTGVEVDPTTAAIAHYLYPSQQIRNHGFERDFASTDRYDAAIGNVPFGDYSLYDDRFNPNGLSVHNHFIKKSLAMTQPGGYVAVITSTFTSDAAREAPRREIAELGDLIGAVRLPSKAFARQAATDVVTDLLVFRRREPDREPSAETKRWYSTHQMRVGDRSVRINDYFEAHPDHVLGRIDVGSGMYGQDTLIVHADTSVPLAAQIRPVLDRVVVRAAADGLALTTTPQPGVVVAGIDTGKALTANPMPGTLRYDEATESFEQYAVGAGWEPVSVRGRAAAKEWQRLLAMGDTVLALSEASRTETSTFEERQELRDRLNEQYEEYVAAYGHLNRYKWTSHRERNNDEQARAKFARLEQKWRLDNGEPRLNEYGEPVIGDDGKPIKVPARGPLPDHIAEELLERSYEPDQKPYKKRSQFEGAIKLDPRIAMVRAIEHYDDDTLTARKASIFTEDAARFREPASYADSVDEAIAITFDERGDIDLGRIAELLGTSVPEALEQARGKIFPDLDTPGKWVSAARFLSGNVRKKLERAKAAAAADPQTYGPSVEALTEAIPPDVDLTKIGIRPGAEWLGADTYREFFRDEFELEPHQITVDFSEISGSWQFETKRFPQWAAPDTGYRDDWGLESADVSGVELFEMIANNRAVESPKTAAEILVNPKPKFHPERTELLRAKAVQLEEKFTRWLWSDAERAERLTQRFNEKLNSFNRVRYPTEHKTFPGLNPKYVPYDYQVQAAVRQLHEETILLDHCVGTGKTLTISMSCMEMRRLGQIRQPWVVVPNFLVDQWHREVLDAYPSANILVATDLSGPAARQRFLAQTALGDWDMVIVPQSVFGLIGVSPEWEASYIERQIEALEAAHEAAKEASGDEKSHSVKQLAKAIERERKKHTKLVEGKDRDGGLTFEQSGCDFIFVDEAHLYKNLTRGSNSADLALVDGSQRASDLEMKALYLRERATARNIADGRPNAPARAVSFATGTPVSNSLAELWVMKRFLRPDLLEAAGMMHIDAWAQTFAKQRTTVEMNITGSQLRAVSRMAEYNNMPQLLAMLDQFRDVVTRDQIPAKLPRLKDDKRTLIEFELAQQVRDFMYDLDARMARTSGKTMHIDNALKIGSDGLNASLYPPLANLPEPDPENNRLALTADVMWRIHTENAHVFTPADAAGPDSYGVFQLVFCDRGTPKPTDTVRTRNLYTRLRDELVARGMAREEIAFIHHYPSARAKQQLFADCRAGRVRVLIGSTEKMGVGMNVQRIAKSLVHLSVPYRASDLAQREGRIIRQGNRMEEIEIIQPVAVKSYDGTSWQIIERKAHIDTYLRSADCPTAIEDIGGDMSVSAAHTKAAATGDPVYIAAVDKEAEVKAMRAEQTMIAQSAASRTHTLRKLEQKLTIKRQELTELQEMSGPLGQWRASDRDKRAIVIGGRSVNDDDTTALAEATQAALNDLVDTNARIRSTSPAEPEPYTLFEVGGVPIRATLTPTTKAMTLTMDGNITRVMADSEVTAARAQSKSAHGLLRRVRNMVDDALGSIDQVAEDVEEIGRRIEQLRSEPAQEFTRGEELLEAERELAQMKARISAQENSPAALSARAADFERRQSLGQYSGWTLDLNPTQGRADDLGVDRETLPELVPIWMNDHARDWKNAAADREARRRDDPWQPSAPDGSRYRYGADPDTGEPGASIEWTGEHWHWKAWDGAGRIENDLTERRDSAQHAASRAVALFKDPDAEIEAAVPAEDRDVAKRRVELRRLGEHAAKEQPDWTAHLGPLPERPIAQEHWINTAALIAAYRQEHDITEATTLLGDRPGSATWAQQWDQLTQQAAELRTAAATAAEHTELPLPSVEHTEHNRQAAEQQRWRQAASREPVEHRLAPSI